MKPRRTAHVTTAILAGVSMALAGCVSSGRFTEVQQQRDLLDQRNEALQKQMEEINQAREALAQEKMLLGQEKNALATEKTALQENLDKLQTKESALGSKLRQQEEESKRLQSTYDGLLANLKKELQAGQIQVQQLRDGLRVNVAQDILFDSGSAALDTNGVGVLNRVAVQLKKSPHQILVIGHTDNKPIGPALMKQYPTNWELAGARAASVVRLFEHSGLSIKRMLAVSVANAKPVASNATEEGRARNRRIEIRLRPLPTED
jgi:chemotaxis protein MotB